VSHAAVLWLVERAVAQAVADRLGMRLARLLERFPDGELHVEIRDSVRGRR
jgi:phosphoribosylpyrophosphate synthetase